MHWLSSWPSLSWCSSSLWPLYTGLLIVQNNVASALFWTMSSGAVAVPIRPLSEPRKYTFSDKKNQFSSSLPVWTKTIPNISRAGQMCLVMCALYIQSWFACNFSPRQLLIAHAELTKASVYGVACANLFLAHFLSDPGPIIVYPCH